MNIIENLKKHWQGKNHQITGQHVDLQLQSIPNRSIKIEELKKFLNTFIPKFTLPQRIIVNSIEFSYRFKKL